MNNMHNGEKRQTEKTEKTAREKVLEYVASEDFGRHATIAATVAATAAATAAPILASRLRMRGLTVSGNHATVLDTIADAVEGAVRKAHDVIGHSRQIGDAGMFGKGYKAGEIIFISKHKRGG